MTRLSIVLSTAALIALVGCSESECRCAPPDLGAPDLQEGVDASPCGARVPTPRELASCGEPLARTGESLRPDGVTDGAATVSAVAVDDGTVRVSVRQDGGATRVLDLPSDPGLVVDDAVELAVDGAGVAVFHEGVFVAYEGGLADTGEYPGALQQAVNAGRGPLVLGPIEGEAEALCVSHQPHHSHFCADVALISFGFRLGDTVVAPGEQVELTFDGRSLVVLNRSITQRDDRYALDCTQCHDYWFPSIDVAIVARPL